MFQYPLSGRRLCSIDDLTPAEVAYYVSVPSIGSKAVQHLALRSYCGGSSCFSTLYRVEGCAAAGHRPRHARPTAFQYPLSGRRLCSDLLPAGEYDTDDVSVPSIGSKAVQHGSYIAFARPVECFSTLYRVEGCAASRLLA
ncbi:protein of unknown function [Candidatus Promineifilum breve]|uniref:Uncharacterized protein n=1 Tax=Candidatus Promineifilum breve TaxID=1806508 RepID=A0A160T3J2_9CHLR|nr:protein of unknown function [Candidatus Promineifilum breve]